MMTRILGPDSPSALLKQGLDASSARARSIADRIANASTPDFAAALGVAQSGVSSEGAAAVEAASREAMLEEQMIALADEQIRFEALTRLLQKTYAQARASVRERS